MELPFRWVTLLDCCCCAAAKKIVQEEEKSPEESIRWLCAYFGRVTVEYEVLVSSRRLRQDGRCLGRRF